ncbi:hypothetical protein AH448_19155 [Salmonella enterica subsp. diarizonae]|uniref:Phage virulence factor n=7 Tax=Salmonella enterica TaxID=28901 RepID=A0A3L7LZK5_SALDZ|nr:hypothetical protein LFZ53_12640 [Salmonella enterica subsp. diarizonae serovar 50:k:z str. MZ0080]ASG83581.1 hypothetical protein LFZ55_11975 [Salmonella enterica subsp. diarizonae serovar 65:c:z str. SA20044251]AXC65139.1 hypothetical protein DOE63_05630 [Salmonella enterica subsp. diarizonae serovar 59:z10:-]AXC72566.1 hypothetical protein DOE59_13855 [Salmonella enterica subsp. diarizonae serovar 48:i:z]AXD72061.1 hypothetical protein CHC34_14580 [Salmonella enterica]EAA0677731.1 hypoth
MINRIFLPLFLLPLAIAFSASAIAASDIKSPPDNKYPPHPFAPWCENWPPDIGKPPEWYQICGC